MNYCIKWLLISHNSLGSQFDKYSIPIFNVLCYHYSSKDVAVELLRYFCYTKTSLQSGVLIIGLNPFEARLTVVYVRWIVTALIIPFFCHMWCLKKMHLQTISDPLLLMFYWHCLTSIHQI